MNPADIQKALDEGRALLVDAEGCDYSWEPKVQRLVAALEAVSREKNEWQARAESAESLMKLEGNIQRLQGELQETKGTLPSETAQPLKCTCNPKGDRINPSCEAHGWDW
jgi:hypothetical protein